MNKPLLPPILFFCLLCIAGEALAASTFHRLLVFNDDGELMLVRFEDSGRWVTPGWYQDDESSIRQGLQALAANHGLAVTEPELRGVFSLRADSDGAISTRLVHSALVKSGSTKLPPGIDRIEWLPVEAALERISFPHISEQIAQVTRHPGTVWGGTQLRYQEDGQPRSRIVEAFHPLAGGPPGPTGRAPHLALRHGLQALVKATPMSGRAAMEAGMTDKPTPSARLNSRRQEATKPCSNLLPC
ncbi:hypothetical protein GCM10011521_14880 [Arenimonas soli]|uniref:Nudix hydrolase domain-containing protein n=1 Tax=Arenimonas soli TaxID=2269504 RepID=A0ABQ1HIG1_9GAMM|nr:NUDIX hydrolase [Arenimonas soli]GGA77594.1 hypothetical protein GCM10011521_14880 [Arenimonas soli]